jgi:hypothetical protein
METLQDSLAPRNGQKRMVISRRDPHIQTELYHAYKDVCVRLKG